MPPPLKITIQPGGAWTSVPAATMMPAARNDATRACSGVVAAAPVEDPPPNPAPVNITVQSDGSWSIDEHPGLDLQPSARLDMDRAVGTILKAI